MKILSNFILATIVTIYAPSCYVNSLVGSPFSPRPEPDDAAVFARWMVSQSSWGVLGTLDLDGAPFGNVMSFADAGTGNLYFYLSTTLDPTGYYALKNQKSSFTISEYSLGSCNQTTDPQSPICAKITLTGKLKLLWRSKEAGAAEAALFEKHPGFAGFPKQNGFRVFKLVITKIFLVNSYAAPRNLTVYEYFHSTI